MPGKVNAIYGINAGALGARRRVVLAPEVVVDGVDAFNFRIPLAAVVGTGLEFGGCGGDVGGRECQCEGSQGKHRVER